MIPSYFGVKGSSYSKHVLDRFCEIYTSGWLDIKILNNSENHFIDMKNIL